LYISAAGAFAVSQGSQLVYIAVGATVVSLFWNWKNPPSVVESWAKGLLWILLSATVVLGWVVMSYPVLAASTVTFVSGLIGYPLLLLGAFFLVGPTFWSLSRTFILSTVAVIALASYRLDTPLHPYLLAAGIAGFVYLALGSVRSAFEAGVWKRAVALVVYGLVTAGIAVTIIRMLPWAQGRVEESMAAMVIPSSGISGYGSESALGELSELKLSRRVVLRMWADRPRKLRRRVLTSFSGKLWHGRPTNTPGFEPSSSLLALDPGRSRWLDGLPGKDFVIDSTSSPVDSFKILRADSGGGALFAPVGTALVRASADHLMADSAGVLSFPPFSSSRLYGVLQINPVPQRIEDEVDERCLGVPEDTDPRLRKLAEELGRGAATTEEMVRRTVNHVSLSCSYSLEMGEFETDQPVAEFLFEKKRGYCEYFATSAALLLRLQGVPTRYVSGFNVIETNREGDHYVVRESDAHAWIEAYLPKRGWVEYDPTPSDEYEELHAGLGTGWFREVFERLSVEVSELWARAMLGDWRFVLARLSSGRWLTALFLVVVAAGVIRWARRLRVKENRIYKPVEESQVIPSELIDGLKALDREWKKLGLARPTSRAPLEHWLSLPDDKIPSELRHRSRRLIDCFYRASFGNETITVEELESLKE
jgi:transglutaminase-like putative cysteine protease